jgi:protein tyrosine phosphatase (PTP) superfamily phosphohydrolase (DUF442 family)
VTPEEKAEALVRSDMKPDEATARMLAWCKDGGREHVKRSMTIYMDTRNRVRSERIQAHENQARNTKRSADKQRR